MIITASKNVPCVSQTSSWRGCFEEHFLTGEQINKKYPILNGSWIYASRKLQATYDGYYYYQYSRLGTEEISDPWYRELKDKTPFKVSDIDEWYHTTVESNGILLVLYKYLDV